MDRERGNKRKYYTLGELTELVSGQLEGNSNYKIYKAAGIENSDEKTITFAENDKYYKKAKKSGAGAVIVYESMKAGGENLIKVNNPRKAYARIADLFAPDPFYKPGIHETAVISDSAEIGQNVSIHPGVVVEEKAVIGDNTILAAGVFVGTNVKIGSNTIIHPRVVIEYNTEIGSEVIIHGGSVIGSDGYGYVSDQEGHHKIPQLGKVIIEDKVEIGANVTIDRAASGSTLIGKGTKIDNLVQIAHNVKTGEHNLIIAQTGIAGSSKLGERVVLAGQTGVIDHIKLGDGTRVATNSVVTKNTEGNNLYSGNPAQDHKDELRIQAARRKLPELVKKIKKLEKKINKLEGKEDDK